MGEAATSTSPGVHHFPEIKIDPSPSFNHISFPLMYPMAVSHLISDGGDQRVFEFLSFFFFLGFRRWLLITVSVAHFQSMSGMSESDRMLGVSLCTSPWCLIDFGDFTCAGASDETRREHFFCRLDTDFRCKHLSGDPRLI